MTMEINITSLLDLDAFDLSHSQMEGGPNAGPNTWKASLSQAEETPLLDTPEKLQAMRDFARSSGGWDQEEIDAWTPTEINALFLQWVAGDIRQCPGTSGDRADSLEEIDWQATQEMQEEGRIPSCLYRADDGTIYFYLGN
jgi:hypothetical protein